MQDPGKGVVPRVSVVMATWNGEFFIEKQIRSIVAQSFPVEQIVIYDDGSTDGTEEICRSFEHVFPRFVFRSNRSRLGPTLNFLSALNEVEGDIVLLCDQDDLWAADKVATIVGAFTSHDTLAVYHSAVLIDDSDTPLGGRFPDLENAADAGARALRPIYGMSLAFSVRLLGLLQPKYHGLIRGTCGHDYWIYATAMMLGQVCHLSDALSMYRQHDGNYTGKPKATGLIAINATRRAQYEEIARRMRAILDAVDIWQLDGCLREFTLKQEVVDHYKFVEMTYREKLKIYQTGTGIFARFRSVAKLMSRQCYAKKSRVGLGCHSFFRDVIFSIAGS